MRLERQATAAAAGCVLLCWAVPKGLGFGTAQQSLPAIIFLMSGAETSEGKIQKKTGCFGYIVLSVLILLVLRGFVGSNSTHEDAAKEAVKTESQPEIPFDRMTPSQHLEKAKAVMTTDDPLKLSPDQIKEATRHLSAIPDKAPEAAETLTLQKQWVDATKEKYLGKVRQKYTNDLETLLKEKGFDVVVTELGDQLILGDDLFKDEANRVEFLGTIRQMRDSQGLCAMGFRRVAIGGRGMFADNSIYSLGCRPKKGK